MLDTKVSRTHSAPLAPSPERRLGTATGLCKFLQSVWKSTQGVGSRDLEKASQVRGKLRGTSKNELRLARPLRGEGGRHSRQRKLLEVKKNKTKQNAGLVCAGGEGETKALLAFIRKLSRVR